MRRKAVRAYSDEGGIFRRKRDFTSDSLAFLQRSGENAADYSQKIEAAMDRLGYRPNLFAVNFNRRNTKTVGIIVPTLLDPFYAALVQRIEFQALEAGYWSVIQSSQSPEKNVVMAI